MDDKLERILEEGIASYAAGEPLIGLPERILGGIGADGRHRKWNLGWGVVAALGTAGMAWLMLLPAHKGEARPVQIAAVTKAEVLTAPLAERHEKRRARPAKTLPKLPIFPTPTPLTAEERGLMALIKQDPEGTAAAFESLHKKSEPLEIEEIVVEPLEQ